MIEPNEHKMLSSAERVALRRAERRQKRMRFYGLVGAAAVVVILIGVAASGILGSSSSKNTTSATSPNASAQKTRNVDLGEKPTIAVVGVESKTGKSEVKGILIMRFGVKEKRVDGISVPWNTVVDTQGQGREPISASYASGSEPFLQALNRILPIKTDGLVEVPYSDFERMTAKNEIEAGLKDGKVDKMDRAALLQLGKFASTLGKEEINLIPLPVKPFSAGDGVFYEPSQSEVSRLLSQFWGIKQSVEVKSRVVVLNGSGKAGVGAKAAKVITAAGFEVIATKNAKSFGYRQTEILVYKNGTQAERLRQALGLGVIEAQANDKETADYAVVLGADYK